MAGSAFNLSSYAIATGLVAAAAAVREVLEQVEAGLLPFAVFFPVIALITLRCGLGPAIYAAAASILMTWYAFIPPRFGFELNSRAVWINLALYAASAGLLIWIAYRYKQAIAALQEANKRRELLMAELRHRTKNALTVTSTIISRTLADQPDAARQVLARLRVMHSLDDVFDDDPADAPALLERVFDSELSPYGAARITKSGAKVPLTSRQARSLAILVHELTTNSAKYGCLGAFEGSLNVSWHAHGKDIVVDWRERGRNGNPTPINSSGFGQRIMEAMLRDLDGSITEAAGPDHYTCRITFPQRHDGQRGPSVTDGRG